jgi:hypothetical protein
MDLFFWRGTKELDSFSESLANELYSRFPPAVVEQALQDDLKKNKKLQRYLDDVKAKVVHSKATNKVGVYKKARLHLHFMQTLEELGYDAGVARKISDMLIFHTAVG